MSGPENAFWKIPEQFCKIHCLPPPPLLQSPVMISPFGALLDPLRSLGSARNKGKSQDPSPLPMLKPALCPPCCVQR